MSTAPIPNQYESLIARILSARDKRQPLFIRGGGSKLFYGRACDGEILETGTTAGIIAYEPTELVLTACAGTPLTEINKTLAESGQMLAFEPPAFADTATLGGTVACGFSGPRRPFVGSVRDFILGTKCLTGKAEVLSFGGQVMKNVAGYDVSRLMTGALGTLGVILEVSIKVLPKPEYELSLTRPTGFNQALADMNNWSGKSLSLSAACLDGDNLNIRLSGKTSAVKAAAAKLDLDEHPDGLEYWDCLREQQLPFFTADDRSLWRLSVPPLTGMLDLAGDWLLDWGGAQRWLKTEEPAENIRAIATAVGGHATLFRNGEHGGEVFQPLSPGIRQIHRRLKQAFDPDRILNPGRMYPDL
ncbi:MAG TPA: glycolate oxidase subunit GlcE [Gammaproteobacteria bacterium]|nr:glycolate oxidase subunit GlcE [Gammaproteobacteria bacterium]